MTKSAQESRWVTEHIQQYAGKWVALDGSTLLASGKNLYEVFSVIGGLKPTPFITYIGDQQ